MAARYKVLLASIIAYQALLTFVVFDFASDLLAWVRTSEGVQPIPYTETPTGRSGMLIVAATAGTLLLANVLVFALSAADRASTAGKA